MIFNLPMGLDFLGVGFFAMSGAVAAIERRADIVTFLFFGAVTGIGGGTLRDLLIGVPVFWVREPAYLIVCALASAAVFFFLTVRSTMATGFSSPSTRSAITGW